MMADESTKHVAAKYTPDQIGRRLGQLKSQGYPIDYGRNSARQRTRTWSIQRNRNQETPTEDESDPF
jgi:hypothetical protein